MKKMIIAGTIAAVVGAGSLVTAVGAYMERAVLSPDVSVMIDSSECTFYSAQGKELLPILYKGTTYIPLRSVGELMGKNVNWDATTKTATLSGTRQTGAVTGTPDTTTKETTVELAVHPEYHIVIDGTERSFFDADGKSVSPVVYNGSIYLPIRSIGEIMGKTVSWDKTTQTVHLVSGEVTDFDTAGTLPGTSTPTQPTTPSTPPAQTTPAQNTTGQSVTLEQAKTIALNAAGKTASQVTFVKTKQDYDNGRQVYEIEFVSLENGVYKEYDYEIEVSSGKILSYDFDIEGYQAPVYNNKTNTANTNTSAVSESSVKKTVLAKVPGATEANIYKFKLDYDDGRAEYEGEIIYNQMEYDFEVDAQTGTIIKWEAESIYD